MTKPSIEDDERKNNLHREIAARKAKIEGYIKLIDLESILAVDNSYSTETLEYLDSIFKPSAPQPKNFKSMEYRHGFWLFLLLRWTGLRGEATKVKLPDIGKYLSSYLLSRVAGNYEPIHLRSATSEYFDKAYISLAELSAYFKNIEYVHQISLPLPILLRDLEFPISAREVMQRLGIDVRQFVHALKNGLMPYESEGEPSQRQLDIHELCNPTSAMPKGLDYEFSDASKLINSLRFMPTAVKAFLKLCRIPKKISGDEREVDKIQRSGGSPDYNNLKKRFRSKRALEKSLERADKLLDIRSNKPSLTRSALKENYKTFVPGGPAWSTFIRDMQVIQRYVGEKYKNLLPRDHPGSKKRKKAKII